MLGTLVSSPTALLLTGHLISQCAPGCAEHAQANVLWWLYLLDTAPAHCGVWSQQVGHSSNWWRDRYVFLWVFASDGDVAISHHLIESKGNGVVVVALASLSDLSAVHAGMGLDGLVQLHLQVVDGLE